MTARTADRKHVACENHARGHYVAGCDGCRSAQRTRVATNRAERLLSGRLTHGTRSAYDAGCRCGPCRSRRAQANS